MGWGLPPSLEEGCTRPPLPQLGRDGSLIKIGRDRGWVTESGTLVPPGTEPPSPTDDLNAAIRRAAGAGDVHMISRSFI